MAAPIAEVLPEAKRIVGLGFAFLLSGVLATVVPLIARTWVVQGHGLEGNGVYQAAWALSGMAAGFIVSAMGSDFYPRLTAAANDHGEMNRLVNEQTETGVLLALPGLLAMICFSPLIIRLCYSLEFAEAGDHLPWFVAGVFCKVVSWPVAFILVAKGNSRGFALSEVIAVTVHLFAIFFGLRMFGLVGLAFAFILQYLVYYAWVLVICGRYTGYRVSRDSLNVLLVALALIVACFLTAIQESPVIRYSAASFLTLGGFWYSAHGLLHRLGAQHRLSSWLRRLPGQGSR